MDGLIIHEALEPKLPTMIVAFAGWPDAAESATRAARYLVRKLPAKKFAEIDPEEFYDFTTLRPETRVNRGGERVTRWATNDLYHYRPEDGSDGLFIYIGTEPNLKWKTFSNILVNVAEQVGVEFVVTLGALLDAVPHSREARVTGRASSKELTEKAEWLGVRNSGYQGPTGIHTAFLDACTNKGLPYASIWGHCPHYVNTSPNPKISHALLAKLRSLVEVDVDLEELRLAGEAFESEVTKAISNDVDVSSYVQRLEERYDAANPLTDEIPSPDAMVQELEEYLKRSQRQGPDIGGNA